MKLIDFMILAAVAALLFLIVRYIYKQKKKGVQCIGCPDSKTCSGHCSGCNGNCGNCTGKAKTNNPAN